MTGSPQADPRFQALLADFDGEVLQNNSATIYGLWPDLTLAYFNSGWTRFAALNDGQPQISAQWPLGRCILDAIAPPILPFFVENYRRSLREQRPWEHVYECSSAGVFRKFHLTAYPLGEAEGLLVVNSLEQEVAHTQVASPPLEELYRDADDIVMQCCHCRRVRRVGERKVWDWVPAWLTHQPANTSHGLCEPCMGFHYSEQRIHAGGVVEPFKTWP